MQIDRYDDELTSGLIELRLQYPALFTREGMPVTLRKSSLISEGYDIYPAGDGIIIDYARRNDAFRALGRIISMESPFTLQERPSFSWLGAMLDVSRNAVPRVETVKYLLIRLALMGINRVMLYTEDTFELPGEPFFGYLRGAYTKSELTEMDNYADALGIELVPCIQTLGHFGQVLRWPAYGDIKDTGDVMLAGEERTYELLDKMIASAATSFRSRNIHIGMDEAHGLGLGAYLKRFGYRDAFAVFQKHLLKVREICSRYGLQPMIWSDMYFRIASETGDYYDDEAVIPQEIMDEYPKDVSLVYWDYYHNDPGFYRRMLAAHRRFGCELTAAPAIWTCLRFWPSYSRSFVTATACIKACMEEGIRRLLITCWGDDGGDCDFRTILPGMLYLSELAWNGRVDKDTLGRSFKAICGGDIDLWMKAEAIDLLPGMDAGAGASNMGRSLLFQDPLLGVVEPWLGDADLDEYYAGLAQDLLAASNREEDRLLRLPALAAVVLKDKWRLWRDLTSAYHAKDSSRILEIADEILPRLRDAVSDMCRCHRSLWLESNKPFGLEVLEHRYGGLLMRLETLRERLHDWLSGRLQSIPELEVLPLAGSFAVEPDGMPLLNYRQVSVTSNISK